MYKLMSNNFFMNNVLTSLDKAYKIQGKTLTNFQINASVGSLFTSGETISSLKDDMKAFKKRNIGGIPNYVAEGLPEMNDAIIDTALTAWIDCIRETDPDDLGEKHLAIKISALLTLELLTKYSKAQELFTDQILKFN
mmetsp:Transcript_41465/g.39893  ORF Transcript_41465/g.39893 Transcript_41465/m.39893 type:complete len:138 (-) Transcript_41465:236-649(-)